jgi:hypothetical protein
MVEDFSVSDVERQVLFIQKEWPSSRTHDFRSVYMDRLVM